MHFNINRRIHAILWQHRNTFLWAKMQATHHAERQHTHTCQLRNSANGRVLNFWLLVASLRWHRQSLWPCNRYCALANIKSDTITEHTEKSCMSARLLLVGYLFFVITIAQCGRQACSFVRLSCTHFRLGCANGPRGWTQYVAASSGASTDTAKSRKCEEAARCSKSLLTLQGIIHARRWAHLFLLLWVELLNSLLCTPSFNHRPNFRHFETPALDHVSQIPFRPVLRVPDGCAIKLRL